MAPQSSDDIGMKVYKALSWIRKRQTDIKSLGFRRNKKESVDIADCGFVDDKKKSKGFIWNDCRIDKDILSSYKYITVNCSLSDLSLFYCWKMIVTIVPVRLQLAEESFCVCLLTKWR